MQTGMEPGSAREKGLARAGVGRSVIGVCALIFSRRLETFDIGDRIVAFNAVMGLRWAGPLLALGTLCGCQAM